jgi:hypothetical protein
VSRLDAYTAVHKMQRARLFDLTIEAGTTDPNDTIGSIRIAEAVGALCAELAAHADHEDRFLHPQLRQHVPTLAAKLDAQHVELDAHLDELHRVAAAHAAETRDANVLYRALAAFTATYLVHLACEEGEALPALWERCSDAELLDMLTSFKGSRSTTENLTSVLAQLPTLNPPEIERLVSAGVDAAETSGIAEILATVLRPAQLGALYRSNTLRARHEQPNPP